MTVTLDPRHVSLLFAGPERAADIAALHAQLFNPAWSEDSVRQLLEHPAAASFVALTFTPRATIGFVLSQIAGDEAEILSIGVAPAHQRQGAGELIVAGLSRALKRSEVTRVFLEVAVGNTAARSFYEKLGFKEIGRRKAYYQKPGGATEDAVNLALEI